MIFFATALRVIRRP